MRGWFSLAVVFAACTNDPFAPMGDVEQFTPPPVYRDWYAAAAQCSGRAGNFDTITWEVADSLASPDGQGETAGTWDAPHRITLRRDHLAVEWTVKHEMLHDLLQRSDHPRPPFGTCEIIP